VVSLGERITNRRQELGITQRQLATVLNITPQHISAIEKEKGAPSLAFLIRLAEELGVTTDYLLTGKESVLTDSVAAIKADKSLDKATKSSLVSLIRKLRIMTNIIE
jgi:transcriptional regulator with XRE-family HTH domain